MAGTAAALDRVRSASPPPRPELADAFAALNEGSMGVRLLIVPSADTRRILEEMAPMLPQELGGGPVTELTRGFSWAAIGLDAGPNPSFKAVVAAPSPDAANAQKRFGERPLKFSMAEGTRATPVRSAPPVFSKLATQVNIETTQAIESTLDGRMLRGCRRPDRLGLTSVTRRRAAIHVYQLREADRAGGA